MNKSIIRIIGIFIFILFTHGTNAQWQQMFWANGNMKVTSFVTNGNTLFTASNGGIHSTTNNGLTWTPNHNGIGINSVYDFKISGSNIYAANNDIYLSTNNGTSWTNIDNGIPLSSQIYSLATSGNNIFTGTFGHGIFLSTNGGMNWSSINNGIPVNSEVHFIIINDNYTYCCTSVAGGVYLSKNNGLNWISIYNDLPPGLHVLSLLTIGSKLFAGTSNGIYLSTNNGLNWVDYTNGIDHVNMSILTVNGNNIYAATHGLGILMSTNEGENWININGNFNSMPLSQSTFTAIGFTQDYIYTSYIFSNNGAGVWRRPLSEITGIAPTQNGIPDKFSLSQNYPNPFNPATIISYDLPVGGFVSLVIYDVLGREVKTLVNENQNAGSYDINWDASNNPSGVYFYKLTSGKFTQTRKMLMIK